LGKYIYKNLFEEYTEKLWGIPCHLISEDYGKALIGFGKFDLARILKTFRSGKENVYAAYLYPKNGMSQIWNDLQGRIEGYGGVFRFGSMLDKFVINENVVKGIGLQDGSVFEYDHVISTIPENMILGMIENVPDKVREAADSIEYRDVVCVFLRVEPVEFMEDNNLYIYNKTIKAVRITNYNRFKNMKGNDILMFEYWTGPDSEMSTADPDGMLNLVKRDLANFGLSPKINILDHKVIRLNKAYPIPTLHLQKSKAEVSGFLANIRGLLNTGRSNQANFNFGMAEAVGSGIAAAASIVR
jgi:protoporphyrinogen oxidase